LGERARELQDGQRLEAAGSAAFNRQHLPFHVVTRA
jgi:hypothetical protein